MKLLVATEFPPDAPGGGPAVVRQMLRDFPGEVHWWSVRPLANETTGNGLTTTNQANTVVRNHSGLSFQLSGSHSCPPGKLMPAKKLPRIRAFLMEHLWAPRSVRSLRETIARINPDCIWVIPHDWSIIPLSQVMVKRGSKVEDRQPRVHVTIQDFPDCHGHGGLWREDRARRMARMQEQIYAAADSADATSHPMLEELEGRTGRQGLQMLHQGLEPEDFAYLESKLVYSPHSTLNPRPSPPIKLAYAGTILCEPEFALLVNLLESIIRQRSTNKEPRIPSIELHLYGAHTYADRPWFQPWIIEHGNLPERELLTELRECDWGFIPMSLEDKDPRYNRFSFPTKFITYLAAGLPIISMGHHESSVMKMTSAYNVGLTIQTRNPSREDLANALFAPNAKQFYLPEILRCAREQFDAEAMRKNLWQAFGLVKGS